MTIKDTVWHKLLGKPYVLTTSDSGGEGEPIVLLHGLGLSSHMWQPLVKLLENDNWRIVRPDLLGFGDSPKPTWSNYAIDDHVHAVMATLKKLKITEPVTIIGHSMGSLIAAHIASQYRQKVKRLVLYAPPLFVSEPVFPRHAKIRERYFAFFEYLVSHPKLALLPRRRLWQMAYKLFGLHLDEQKWPSFERSLRNTIMAHQAYNEFIQLTIPTDVIYGRLDYIIVRAEVSTMLKANPNITMHTFTGTHTLTGRASKFLYGILNQPKGIK